MPKGPRLEALLHQRDHLRIRINAAEAEPSPDHREIAEMRRELLALDHQILTQWSHPSA